MNTVCELQEQPLSFTILNEDVYTTIGIYPDIFEELYVKVNLT
jgi:hypothetical protein